MKALQFSVSVPQFAALQLLGRVSRRFFYMGPLATVRLAEVPEPGLPSPDWVKIKTLVCGFCGSDVSLVLLRDSPSASPFTSFPCTMGHEFSGEVVEVGGNVTGVREGDPVTVVPSLSCATRGIDPECAACRMGRPSNCENFALGDLAPGMFLGICRDVGGGFAPYVVAHRAQVFKLPREMSAQEGAMMEPCSVALQAVHDNRPDAGDQVLVIGGGVIGNLIIQAIRALDIGCSITVAEPSRFHAELASRAGADRLIVDGDILNHAKEITGAKGYKPLIGREVLMGGFSRVYDTVASAGTLRAGMWALRAGGVYSIVGIGKEVMPDPTPLWLKLQTIKGVYCYGYTGPQGNRRHMFETAIDFVSRKKMDAGSLITHTFALDDYRQMIEVNLNKHKHNAVKTVVSFP